MNNTLFSLTQYALSELKDTYSENEIRSICRLIFMDVLKYTNINIHLKKYESLPESFVNKFYNITVRLKKNEPIQYIIGETEFAGLRFKLSPAVLIPRPETEELIYWIKESVISPRQVLDIGTGSGCIAITLARAFPSARVQAVDVSEEALQIARHNAISNAAPVLFQQKDILNYKAEKEEKYDLIVSNPPYVRQCENRYWILNLLRLFSYRMSLPCFFTIRLQNWPKQYSFPKVLSSLKLTKLSEKKYKKCSGNLTISISN